MRASQPSREQVRVAERQIELERTNLDNTVIRAPFSGIAISKDAQPGEMVSPVSAGGGFTRTGICTIVDMRSLEIEVDVNESYINRVKSEQDVTAVLDAYPDLPDSGACHHDGADSRSAEGHRARAHRLQAARSADPAGHGREGHLSAETRTRPTRRRRAPVTLVPKAAIRTENNQTYAFVGRERRRRSTRRENRRRRRRSARSARRSQSRASASSCRRRPGLTGGARVTVK